MSYIPEDPNKYAGKQAIINSDRILFNAKEDSILLYSNEAIGFSTNGNIHFDTDNIKSGENENKFVVNSPNIYLGLDYQNRLPTNPAVKGEELEYILDKILETIDDLIDDILYKIQYSVMPAPGGGQMTAPSAANASFVQGTRNKLEKIQKNLKSIHSKNVKIGE